jgi:hypothetical protein
MDLPAAHGREKANLIALMKGRSPGGKFLVARSNQRAAIARQLRVARGILRENAFDGRPFGQLDRFFGAASDFLQSAKKEHFYADGLGDDWHRQIVTPGVPWQPAQRLVGTERDRLGHDLGTKHAPQRIVAQGGER